MNVAILGERSGRVREAFIHRGHHAVSYDLHESQASGPHVQGDYMTADLSWADTLIMFPDCTYLAVSGLHWNKRRAGRAAQTDAAVEHVRRLIAMGERVGRYAIENPIGCLSTRIREPDQIIQPYQYGDDASKATCLWLHNLPRLTPTTLIAPRIVWKDGKPAMRWSNQTDSGQNELGPSDDRAYLRAMTYPGIASAMAEQWGGNLECDWR